MNTKKNRMVLLPLMLLFLCKNLFSQVKQVKPILTIGAYDMYPLYVTVGDYKNKGVFDFYLEYIHQELSNKYKVEVILYPKTRTIKNLLKYDNYCVFPMYKSPERDKLGIHSIANYALVGNYVIMAKKGTFPDAKSLPEGKLSLKEIFEVKKDLIIGLEQDSNHGIEIQSILDQWKLKHPDSFFYRPGVGSHYALYRMLKNNRVQFILVLATEIYWIKKIKNDEIDFDFQLYDIKEFTKGYQETYTYCAKSKFGKEVIEDINRIHRDKYKQEKIMQKFNQGLDLWFPKELSEKNMHYQQIMFESNNSTQNN